MSRLARAPEAAALRRLALVLCACTGALAWSAILADAGPHLDAGEAPEGCLTCHRIHGAADSPMLPESSVETCLACHGSAVQAMEQVAEGLLAPSAHPQLLAATLSQPYRHPLRESSGAGAAQVTCASCHSSHRGMAARPSGDLPAGVRLPSPKNPAEFEIDLCLSCHGESGPEGASAADIGRLIRSFNRSYHPFEAPVSERSRSILPELAGREINCTDCHGNSDASGPRGPHGSALAFVVRLPYRGADGGPESPAAFALCYRCHRREIVLDDSTFPYHRLHVIEEGASCATCHSAHGSLENRALIRFGDQAGDGMVAPSLRAGKLAFISSGSGAGACFLSCHGVDHAPESYGGFAESAALAVESSDGLGDLLGLGSREPLLAVRGKGSGQGGRREVARDRPRP